MRTVMAQRAQDVIAVLMDDHAQVKKLFNEFEGSNSEAKKETLAQQICEMLTVHATCEEEIVYPAAHAAFQGDDVDLVNEAAVEHATAKDLIAQIQTMGASDEMFDPTVKVLSEYITHHVLEEEGEMFPKLRKTDLDLDDLGRQILRRKVELADQPPKKASVAKAGRASRHVTGSRKTGARAPKGKSHR
jgi:hemerythrin superfamily protein